MSRGGVLAPIPWPDRRRMLETWPEEAGLRAPLGRLGAAYEVGPRAPGGRGSQCRESMEAGRDGEVPADETRRAGATARCLRMRLGGRATECATSRCLELMGGRAHARQRGARGSGWVGGRVTTRLGDEASGRRWRDPTRGGGLVAGGWR
jgi:hypothetical protein